MLEDGDTVVVLGTGRSRFRDQSTFEFAYCDAFTFRGDVISVVDPDIVPLDLAARRRHHRRHRRLIPIVAVGGVIVAAIRL